MITDPLWIEYYMLQNDILTRLEKLNQEISGAQKEIRDIKTDLIDSYTKSEKAYMGLKKEEE